MRVHGDVVRAEERTAEPTVIPSGVLLVHAHNYQPLLRRLDELVPSGAVLVRYLVPAFLLAVVVPPHFLIRQHFWHLNETAQMHRLSPGDHQLPLPYAAVANVRRAVRYVLEEPAKYS